VYFAIMALLCQLQIANTQKIKLIRFCLYFK
jgi:hypothetical protein